MFDQLISVIMLFFKTFKILFVDLFLEIFKVLKITVNINYMTWIMHWIVFFWWFQSILSCFYGKSLKYSCKTNVIQSSEEVKRSLVLKEKRQCTAHALLSIRRFLIKTHIYFLKINSSSKKRYELSSFSFITLHYCIIFRSEIVIILISL